MQRPGLRERALSAPPGFIAANTPPTSPRPESKRIIRLRKQALKVPHKQTELFSRRLITLRQHPGPLVKLKKPIASIMTCIQAIDPTRSCFYYKNKPLLDPEQCANFRRQQDLLQAHLAKEAFAKLFYKPELCAPRDFQLERPERFKEWNDLCTRNLVRLHQLKEEPQIQSRDEVMQAIDCLIPLLEKLNKDTLDQTIVELQDLDFATFFTHIRCTQIPQARLPIQKTVSAVEETLQQKLMGPFMMVTRFTLILRQLFKDPALTRHGKTVIDKLIDQFRKGLLVYDLITEKR